MFEFDRCSKNDVRVRSMFDKMVFDTSLEIDTLLAPQPHFLPILLPQTQKAITDALSFAVKRTSLNVYFIPSFRTKYFYSYCTIYKNAQLFKK